MSSSQATHSIAELITEFHKTKGTVPPLLIGASTTLYNKHIYLFGGRLQSTRQISNQVYVLALETKTWKLVHPENTAPTPRYFHSASHDQRHSILFFGGMGTRRNEIGIDEMAPLNDIVVLNLQTMSWEYPKLPIDSPIPSPRYAHLSTYVKNKLIIMGGQDKNNEYIQDIQILDTRKSTWCPSLSSQQFQYGAYRSAAVAVTPIDLTPPIAPTMDLLSDSIDDTTIVEDAEDVLVHLYSNTQTTTTEVDRLLHTWKLNHANGTVELQDQSDSITTSHTMPPPLKFPSAFMCGQQFILAGPHLSATHQQFQIWALDTTTKMWTKIEAGHVLARGSWLKGMLCEHSNRFVVFGHPNRSMQNDYKDRVHCFEHMACVDMEIFGIYRPPRTSFSAFSQGLGLTLLKDPLLADLRITTIDQHHVSVNSALLAQRWPMIQQVIQPLITPQMEQSECLDFEKRELNFPDTYVVLIAFLQYIYTDHLVTAQQHQPHILARLLFIADLFHIERLKALAIHALHQMLNIQTATMIYESAALSNAVSLQIRALRVMINAKKMMQRQKQLELQRRQQQQQQPPQKTIPEKQTLPSIPPQQKQQHQRTSSQRSISTNESSPTTTPPTTPATKSIKLPHFRSMRQASVSNQTWSDLEPTLPRITPTNKSTIVSPSKSTTMSPSKSTTVSPSKSTTTFWRQNTSTSTLLSKKNTPSKSESSVRLPFFLN